MLIGSLPNFILSVPVRNLRGNLPKLLNVAIVLSCGLMPDATGGDPKT